MIKTRIASAAALVTFGLAALVTFGLAALVTFGLAALGGAVVAAAAPANADTVTTASSESTAGSPHKVKPNKQDLFPTTPHSPHEGHGREGSNEPQGHPPVIWPALDVSTTS